jgi:hypothetical protein
MSIDWNNPNPWYLIAAAVVAILGVGRLTRVLVVDSYPPAAWLRDKWRTVTKDGDWSLLALCFWCSSPWIMAVAMVWFWGGTHVLWLGVAWWVFWGWLALSYATAMVIARDDPHDD